MTRLQTVYSVTDIQANADRCGSFWFSPDTMRFWRTRVLSGVYPMANGSILFVTSDRTWDDGREYKVRSYSTYLDDNGMERVNIDTVGNSYSTARAAKKMARTISV
jgi:hypothetical protein